MNTTDMFTYLGILAIGATFIAISYSKLPIVLCAISEAIGYSILIILLIILITLVIDIIESYPVLGQLPTIIGG